MIPVSVVAENPGVLRLATSTLGADAASIDIQNITAGFRALRIFCSLRSTRAGQPFDSGGLRFNNDSGANYYSEFLFATGVTEDSTEEIAATSCYMEMPGATAPADWFSSYVLDVYEYSTTTRRKSATASFSYVKALSTTNILYFALGHHWDSMSAIDRITVFANTGNLLAGSSITVYGMA